MNQKKMKMTQSLPMKGGDDSSSYSNNSYLQRDGASVVMDVIKDAVIENLDIDKLMLGSDSGSGSGSTTFTIADLGCSTGPNTFHAVQTLIEAVQHKHNNRADLEFLVLFNDQIGNDFNTLFASLPQPRNYLAAGVPGSLYGRIFPSASVHIAYSSYTMHWMSKVPEAMQAKDSPAWNPGKIHYEGASDAVVKAYSDQFEEDMGVFLRARAQEIVGGGMVVILMLGVPHSDVIYGPSKFYSFFGSILMDMVKEGVLEQEEVDSFNIPNYFPCIKEMRSVVEKNGSFEIVKVETMDVKPLEDPDTESVVMQFRAIYEGTFANHFGNEIVDQFFMRLKQQRLQILRILDSSSKTGFIGVLLAVLKRKLL